MKKGVISANKLVPPADFDGPTRSRRCTDVLFFLLLVLTWAIMTALGFGTIGLINVPYLHKGNPQRLLHGIDYVGNICGVDESVKYLVKKWQPNLLGGNLDSNLNSVSKEFSICVSSCPAKGEERSDPYMKYGSWTAPTDVSDVINFSKYINIILVLLRHPQLLAIVFP